MATKEEKQQLIDTLRFTPRTYKIALWGYGGEKVMGTVDPKVWDYCMEHSVDLQDIAWGDEETAQEDMGLDLEMLPFPPGQWYECDNIVHENGVSMNAGTLQIEDENGNTVFEKSLEACDGGEDSPQRAVNGEYNIYGYKKGEVIFLGSSNEKGTFFEGDIELTAPFNIEKLELQIDEIDGEEIVTSVYYDGESIDNYGGSTDGKSSDMIMVRMTDDDNNWERYEPEERDWGHPEHGPSPSDWEASPRFKFKEHKPVHPGYYSANYGYGSTYGTLYWNGEAFGDWEYGKFDAKDDEGIVSWQGYNWDTTSWANQPPAPPQAQCKKCKWIGMQDDMKRDDDYEYHCPECDSTNWDWMDYDPETVKGRKNRAKYCVPAVPTAVEKDMEQALQELKDDYELLMAQAAPWIPTKTKPADPGVYECQFSKPPAWPWPPTAELTWNGKQWLNDDGDAVKGVKEWRVPQGETV